MSLDKVQLDHVLLDVDFFHKPTIVAFRRKFGWVSTPWLIEAYAQMSRATNALVTRDVLLGIADDMRLDLCDEMIAYCIDHGLILCIDGAYSNQRVIKDQESLAKKRKDTKQRQEKHKHKHVSERVSNALYNAENPVTSDTVTVTDTEYLDLKNSEAEPEKSEPPQIEDRFLETALKKLEEPKNQPWMRTNAFICSGRRPMKDYPDLFFKPNDLALILQEWNSTVPKNRWRSGFFIAQDKVRASINAGKKLEEIAIVSWFLTFIRDELNKGATTQARLSKSLEGVQA